MARLKELLFDSEVQTLGELDQRLASIEHVNRQQDRHNQEVGKRVESLFNRAGTEERFRASVAVVLDKALEDAEVRNHDQMARALAPMVVNTIRAELRNSQDELVDIMYPITGRMVKSYLAAEMKKLANDVNRRIDNNALMLRIRSLTSGKSVRDLAIAETQRLSVDEVFLIRRGSGELVGHWPETSATMSNANVHMSGVLAAINDFASSAFESDGGHFESFRYEDFEVYMRASPMYLLAARCSGIAPSGIEQIFDDAFVETMERVAALEQAKAAEGRDVDVRARSLELHPLTEDVEARTTAIYEELAQSRIGGTVVKAVLFLIAVPLLAWFFWGLYTDAEEAIVRNSARSVITGTRQLDGYQTSLDVGYRGKSITVSGLVPNDEVASNLKAALGQELPATKINTRFAVVPKAREVVRELVPKPAPVDIAGLERRLNARMRGIESELIAASARRAIARADDRLRQALPEIDRLERQMNDNGRKADIREVRTALEKTTLDVAALRAQIAARGSDRDGLARLVGSINQTTEAVGHGIASLASIHGTGVDLMATRKPDAQHLNEAVEDLVSQAERMTTLAIALHQTAAMIPEPVVVPPPPEISPEEKLRRFIARNAIFFSTGTDFVSDQETGKLLDEAARLIKAAPGIVRVIGYTDERGQTTQNIELAQNRANKVIDELARRGVERKLLVGLGRPGAYGISPAAGASSPNRRVQFEMGFRGEGRGPR